RDRRGQARGAAEGALARSFASGFRPQGPHDRHGPRSRRTRMTQLDDIAVVGLGVMGANLARNFASKGFKVAGLDRELAKAKKVAADFPEAKLDIAEDWKQLVAKLERPRRIVLLILAGKPI